MSNVLKLLAASMLAMAAAAGCDRDNCVDVQCAPAPPPLTVLVKDSATAPQFATDAQVTLWQVNGADTVVFGTLSLSSDSSYVLNDVAGLTSNPLIVRAMRGQRCGKQTGLRLRVVEGCCGYPIVGRCTVVLADTCR